MMKLRMLRIVLNSKPLLLLYGLSISLEDFSCIILWKMVINGTYYMKKHFFISHAEIAFSIIYADWRKIMGKKGMGKKVSEVHVIL